MSGVRDSSLARCTVLRAQDVRTLSKIDLAANQLPACSGWRFNVIREWQICNAYGFTIYRWRGYMMRRVPQRECKCTLEKFFNFYILSIQEELRHTSHKSFYKYILLYDTWRKYLAIGCISECKLPQIMMNWINKWRNNYRVIIIEQWVLRLVIAFVIGRI